jgi:hypothetical protein
MTDRHTSIRASQLRNFSITAEDLAADSITEDKLVITNDPFDGGYLKYTTTSSGMKWATVSGSAGDYATNDQLTTTSGDIISQIPSSETCVTIVPFESDTAISTGNGKVAWTVPAALSGKNLTAAIASVHTQGSSGTTTVMVRRRRSGSDVDMLSTGITVSYNEYYASDGSINTSNDDISTGDQIYVDIDAAATGAEGLSVTLTFS